jgi:hypothetical protein
MDVVNDVEVGNKSDARDADGPRSSAGGTRSYPRQTPHLLCAAGARPLRRPDWRRRARD